MPLVSVLTQSWAAMLSVAGWPSFQEVKGADQVTSPPPYVPPVLVKLVPSEKVNVSSVVISSRPIQKSAGVPAALRASSTAWIPAVLGAARRAPSPRAEH